MTEDAEVLKSSAVPAGRYFCGAQEPFRRGYFAVANFTTPRPLLAAPSKIVR